MSLPERAELRRAVAGARTPRGAVIGTGGTISGVGRHASLDRLATVVKNPGRLPELLFGKA